jgi:hypothetical protein
MPESNLKNLKVESSCKESIKLRILGTYMTPLIHRSGVPNLGDVRGLKVVITWVHLYQRGDATDVKGDVGTKRLGAPALDLFDLLEGY